MSANLPSDQMKKCFDWRQDLAASRDISAREIDAFGYVLGWIENWRLRNDLPPGRDTARRWWKEEARVEERPAWQLRQWAEAIRWSRKGRCPTRSRTM